MFLKELQRVDSNHVTYGIFLSGQEGERGERPGMYRGNWSGSTIYGVT